MWQDKILSEDEIGDKTELIRTGLVLFQKELETVKSSLLMSGANQHLVGIRKVVALCFAGLASVNQPDLQIEEHCEQLRLRAASLPDTSSGRTNWLSLADFAQSFYQAGQVELHSYLVD